MHLRAARVLIRAEQWTEAYHVAGFAVECGLKACVAKRTKRHDFPPRNAADFYKHDPATLLKAADLGTAYDAGSPAFKVNWTTVKDWTPESRYDQSITKKQACDLYSAITSRKNGVIAWIRGQW